MYQNRVGYRPHRLDAKNESKPIDPRRAGARSTHKRRAIRESAESAD
jgi:hypothetical protein